MSAQRCWTFGENIDTDQIIPSQYLVFPLKDMLSYAMEPQSDRFAKEVKPGDFIVAGGNFGCGSSREQAPLVLKTLGLRAIIAKSFSRIFFRNSINIGLLLIEISAGEEFSDGDLLSADAEKGELRNTTTGKSYRFSPPTGLVKEIFDAGGLLPYLERQKALLLQ